MIIIFTSLKGDIMKYNLLVINKKTDQETLFNGFGNKSLMINFINKHW